VRNPSEALLVVLVLIGAIPMVVTSYQYLLIGFHRYRNHYDDCGTHLPNTAILIPAWNEALVLETSIDQLLSLDYPPDRLRIYVVDDASTDGTPALLARKMAEYPGSVVHLRRDKGGEGKAHTLNHGLERMLQDPWVEAVLIMDADVVYERDSLRRMARHLADPEVGAVTAYIKEGSDPGTAVNRFIAYEYITGQAAARRAQNVLGVLACLAGGAQLHSRANIEAIGGRIDTSSLAEDTFTTIRTQTEGRKVVFEPNATVWAEEPPSIEALWKQRLRWARGNVQVTRAHKHLWFRPAEHHRLGSWSFGLMWFSTLLLPVLMILSSLGLVALWFIDRELSAEAFRQLWIVNALSYVFITTYALLLDGSTAKRAWREAITFPGAVSVAIIIYTCFPRPFRAVSDSIESATSIHLSHTGTDYVMLAAYIWVAACMVGAWAVMRADKHLPQWISSMLLYLVGFGPLLCAITFTAYVKEARHAEQTWDKTEKTGKVAMRA
jgi:cellulose synthase/poly-beta-1,6-N-acetylglucosamine synthase-like glycosyltransferase